MSYATNQSNTSINSQFLSVITPKKRILSTSFAVYSGSVYRTLTTYGYFTSVYVNGTALTSGSSVSLSAGQYYFDQSTSYLYVRKSDSTAPNSGDFVICYYEIYVSTFDYSWFRTPTDTTSNPCYFEARIVKSPVISQSSGDILFGFFPTKSTSINLANSDHFFEQLISDDSLNKAQIKVWHLLGDLEATNFQLVFTGLIGSCEYSGSEVQLGILDETSLFDKEFRHSGTSFYAGADLFLNRMDPNSEGKPIKEVFGMVDGLIPTNIDYFFVSATTGNRYWLVKKDTGTLANVSTTVLAGSTATVTNLTSANGFNAGDSVYFNRVVGTDEYLNITSVDYGANTITHTALAGGAMAAADTCSRSWIGRIDIVQGGVRYQPQFTRDYGGSFSDASCVGFQLANNFEATLGMPTPLSINDTIYCRVYGDKSVDTLSGGAFGSNDQSTGGLSQGIVILYRILKTYFGLAESEIDITTFTTLQASILDTVGFTIPFESEQSFPLYKDILLKLMQTLLLRFGKNASGLWTIRQIKPLTASTKTIEDDEIIREQVSYTFSYSDIVSNFTGEYDFREVGDYGRVLNYRPTERTSRQVPTVSKSEVRQVVATSNNAIYKHGINAQKSYSSLHYSSTYAQTLINRISYALGERRGILKIVVKNRFFDVVLGDTITISREQLPGFAYVFGTLNSKNFVLIESSKSISGVTLILEDQKGIEDNSASW